MAPYRITNIVATARLNCQLNLGHLARCYLGTRYNPSKFSGLLVHTMSPMNAHYRLYTNGKMTINGGKCIDDVHLLAETFSHELQMLGYTCHVTELVVVNMVATWDVQHRLRLGEIYRKIQPYFAAVKYEPELFSGLSVPLGNCTAVVFYSGKINFLGAEEKSDIDAAVVEISLFI